MRKNNAIARKIASAMVPIPSGSSALQLATAYDPATGLDHFPPWAMGAVPLQQKLIGPSGILYTYTRMYLPKDQGSYLIGFADFDEGVRLLGRLASTDGRTPRIGQRLTIAAVDAANADAGYEFRLMD